MDPPKTLSPYVSRPGRSPVPGPPGRPPRAATRGRRERVVQLGARTRRCRNPASAWPALDGHHGRAVCMDRGAGSVASAATEPASMGVVARGRRRAREARRASFALRRGHVMTVSGNGLTSAAEAALKPSRPRSTFVQANGGRERLWRDFSRGQHRFVVGFGRGIQQAQASRCRGSFPRGVVVLAAGRSVGSAGVVGAAGRSAADLSSRSSCQQGTASACPATTTVLTRWHSSGEDHDAPGQGRRASC
ncbi:hypothetical protein HD597_005539 [Nonomuraea thailandensis]|uniref:Uncharacterized protein n=1 Tax=Nonomuraea thailandensis TaxID=1188745 RepID=A0A9X2GJ61_9ACTN|nr:hypothetical protein [Nonomuraea thailandensis]